MTDGRRRAKHVYSQVRLAVRYDRPVSLSSFRPGSRTRSDPDHSPTWIPARRQPGRPDCAPGPSLDLAAPGPEDNDPATLLLSIISSVRRLRADFGAETTAAMRARPGPVFSWPPLFTSLGHELHESLDPSTVLVFENLELLASRDETMRLLRTHILQSLPDQAPCILISNQRLPSTAISEYTQRYDAKDLRLDNLASISLAERISASLPAKHIQRLALLSDGRPELLVGCAWPATCWGRSTWRWNGRTRSVDDLLQTITRTLITRSIPRHSKHSVSSSTSGTASQPDGEFFERPAFNGRPLVPAADGGLGAIPQILASTPAEQPEPLPHAKRCAFKLPRQSAYCSGSIAPSGTAIPLGWGYQQHCPGGLQTSQQPA